MKSLLLITAIVGFSLSHAGRLDFAHRGLAAKGKGPAVLPRAAKKRAVRPRRSKVVLMNLSENFLQAYSARNIGEMMRLLKEGVNVDIKNEDKKTLLHLSANKEDLEMMEFLITKGGAKIEAKDARGRTPFYLAVENGKLQSARLLLEKGANINTRNESEWSALFKMSTEGNLEAVKFLLEKGADSNLAKSGKFPIIAAVQGGHKEIVKALLEKGADPNIRDENGNAPLYIATGKEDLATIEMLLENGADPNFKNQDGWTALFEATRRENVPIIKMLLEKKADPNLKTDDGKTPLDIAVMKGVRELIKSKGGKVGSEVQ